MLKIGEFSRLSRVSVRMLRHYDRLGLLTPSQVDPLTNYRYYSAGQLPRLNRILALQELGFSLEQIGELLNEDVPAEQLRGMLRLKRAEVEQSIQAEQARLAQIEARIRQMEAQAGAPLYDIVVRSVRSELVALRRAIVPDDEHIQAMFHEVEAYVADHGDARADEPPFTIYHDADYCERDIDAEVAVPVKFPIPGNESIQVSELPGLREAACVVHTGAYATLYLAYNALLRWLESSGYQMAGPIREVYLRYGTEGLGFQLPSTYVAGQAEEYVTELQMEVHKT